MLRFLVYIMGITTFKADATSNLEDGKFILPKP